MNERTYDTPPWRDTLKAGDEFDRAFLIAIRYDESAQKAFGYLVESVKHTFKLGQELVSDGLSNHNLTEVLLGTAALIIIPLVAVDRLVQHGSRLCGHEYNNHDKPMQTPHQIF